MLALRAWLVPQIIPQGVFKLTRGPHAECESILAELDPRTFTQEPVGDEPAPEMLHVPTSLLTLGVDECDVHADLSDEWRRLFEAVQQWSLSRLVWLDAISCRVDSAVPVVGVPRPYVTYPGWPPPLAGTALPGGFGLEGSRNDVTPVAAPEHVSRALGWLLRALRTDDPFGRAKSAWLAVESIAQGAGSRSKTRGKVVQKVVECLSRVGVAEDDARALYGVRCDLLHGQLAVATDVAERLGNHSFTIMAHALQVLKLELGWALDRPPFVHTGNGSHAGRFLIHGESAAMTTEACKQPIITSVSPVLVRIGRGSSSVVSRGSS